MSNIYDKLFADLEIETVNINDKVKKEHNGCLSFVTYGIRFGSTEYVWTYQIVGNNMYCIRAAWPVHSYTIENR